VHSSWQIDFDYRLSARRFCRVCRGLHFRPGSFEINLPVGIGSCDHHRIDRTSSWSIASSEVRRDFRKGETFLLRIIFVVGAILGPIVVQTADISKSGTTGGIVGVPAALLVGTLTAAIPPKLREHESWPLRTFRATC
jgi:hypothetical protein